MEQLITNIRPYLEALYFFSGIIVAVAALLALRQIRLMKLDMIFRSDRAAKEKAIETTYEYAKLGSVFQKHFGLMLGNNVPAFYGGTIGDFSPDSISVELKEMASKRESQFIMNDPLNMLDSLAATFVSGVADEKTGFSIIGGAFCGTVAAQYDIICLSRSRYKYGPFSNLIELYQIWSARLSKADLAKARQNLDEKIASIPDRDIPPLSPMSHK